MSGGDRQHRVLQKLLLLLLMLSTLVLLMLLLLLLLMMLLLMLLLMLVVGVGPQDRVLLPSTCLASAAEAVPESEACHRSSSGLEDGLPVEVRQELLVVHQGRCWKL